MSARGLRPAALWCLAPCSCSRLQGARRTRCQCLARIRLLTRQLLCVGVRS